MKLDPAELTGGLELLRMAIDAGDPKSELLLRVDDLLKESRASLPQSQDIRGLVEELRVIEVLFARHGSVTDDAYARTVSRAADALSCLEVR